MKKKFKTLKIVTEALSIVLLISVGIGCSSKTDTGRASESEARTERRFSNFAAGEIPHLSTENLIHLLSYEASLGIVNSPQVQFLTETQVRQLSPTFINERRVLSRYRQFPVQYLSEQQIQSLNDTELFSHYSGITNNSAVVLRDRFPIQFLSQRQVQSLSQYHELRGVLDRDQFPVHFVPVNLLNENRVARLDLVQIQQIIQQEGFPVQYLTRAQVQALPQPILHLIVLRPQFHLNFLSVDQIQDLPVEICSQMINRAFLDPNRNQVPWVQHLTEAQVYALEENVLFRLFILGAPMQLFSEGQKYQLLQLQLPAADFRRLVLDPEFPLNLLANDRDVELALSQLTPEEKIELARRPGFPIGRIPAEDLEDNVVRLLARLPHFPLNRLHDIQVQQLQWDAELLLRPNFPLIHLSRDQIQHLDNAILIQLLQNHGGRIGFHHDWLEFLTDQQLLLIQREGLARLIQGWNRELPNEFVQRLSVEELRHILGKWNKIGIHQLTPAQIQGFNTEIAEDWRLFKALIGNSLFHGHIERIHQVIPHFTHTQFQNLDFCQLEILTNTNPHFPMSMLSDIQKAELGDWLGRFWSQRVDRNRFDPQHPYGHFIVDLYPRWGERRNEIVRLKQLIEQIPIHQIPDLIRNRPGFPVGFLTRDQVQALPHDLVTHLVERVQTIEDREDQELVTQLQGNGMFILREQVLDDKDREARLIYKGIYQRVILFSRGILPVSYLSEEQLMALSIEQRHRIARLHNLIGRLVGRNFNQMNEGRVQGIDELFEHFFQITQLEREPEVH